MLDALAKLGPVVASAVAVIVASLVYRLNSEKLFLDMLTSRREAVNEVLDAAQERDAEIRALPAQADQGTVYNLPAQARFWRAASAAEGLFGPEVTSALTELDDALMEKIGAIFDLRSPHEGHAAERAALMRHTVAVDRLLAARQALIDQARPYLVLGRRGLPLAQRISLWRRDRRKPLRK